MVDEDLKIEAYLNRQTESHRQVIEAVRQIIMMNFPTLQETCMQEKPSAT